MGALGFLGAKLRRRYRADLQDTPSVGINWKEVEWLRGKVRFDDYVLGKFLENLIGCLIIGKKLIMSLNRVGWFDNWVLVEWGKNPEEIFELMYSRFPRVRRVRWCLAKWYDLLGFFGFSTWSSIACCVFYFLIGLCDWLCFCQGSKKR